MEWQNNRKKTQGEFKDHFENVQKGYVETKGAMVNEVMNQEE